MDTNYTISAEEMESIELYLLGEINNGERLAFESKLSEDVVLAAKADEVKLLLAGIETDLLKEQLNGYHLNLKKNNPETGSGKTISISRKLIAAASVALLTGICVWLFTNRQSNYEQLYNAYYKPDPGLMSAMGTSDNYVFNKAMLDYKTGHYNEAIMAWSKLKTNMLPNDTLNYFLGAAQQANGNSTEAIILLKNVASDTTNSFYRDACWYTGLALLQKGAVEEAIPYLEKSGYPQSSELIKTLK